MGRPEKEKPIVEISEAPLPQPAVHSEKEHLLALYQELKDRNIRSISDLEGQIARCE